MARNAIESEFQTSKMSAGGRFVKNVVKKKVLHNSSYYCILNININSK